MIPTIILWRVVWQQVQHILYKDGIMKDTVLYLILMQILLYDQQNVLPYTTITTTGTKTTTSYDTTQSSGMNNTPSSVIDLLTIYKTMHDLYFDITFDTPSLSYNDTDRDYFVWTDNTRHG